MIYTITFNPSLDVKVSITKFSINKLNRYKDEIISAAGKGINVSLMLKTLGIKNKALGFIGGFTGEKFIKLISKKVETDFVKVRDDTRINFKINSRKETEINGVGPFISDVYFAKLEKKISKLKKGDVLIVSGSIPNGQINAYKKIGGIARVNDVLIIADTNSQALKDILKFKPFLIKPNKNEAEELFKIKIKTQIDIIKVLKKFNRLGAENILLSLGEKGAYLLTSDNIYKSNVVKGKVINTIGSGDSMLAGFISGFIKTNNPIRSLQRAVAAGSASAFSPGLANKKDILAIEKSINVIEVT